MEHDLYKNMGDVGVRTDFEMLKVKVPIIFLGTVGFSLRRDGRYPTFVLKGDDSGPECSQPFD